ncbi:MAG: hypothetical protein ACLUSL_10325 [Ruminococcus sp.]
MGTADCDPDESEDFATYEVSLKVKIEHDTMIEITDVKGDSTDYDPENDRYLSRAAKGTSKIKGTIAQILEQQGTEDIDAVSGATSFLGCHPACCGAGAGTGTEGSVMHGASFLDQDM